MAESSTSSQSNITIHKKPPNIRYTSVDGYFLQADMETDAESFDYRRSTRMGTILGLKNRDYESDSSFNGNHRYHHQNWRRFEHFVNWSNANAGENVAYKVLFLGRHGEGYHNVAERDYGTADWDAHYSKLENYTDPHLTPVGYGQAQDVGSFWETAMKYQLVPTPQSFYVSPLARCLSTAMLTYSRLELPKWRPFHATVKEQLRETIGVHTCDKRSTRTWIFEHFNGFSIEPRFTEHDELWTPNRRETRDEQVVRLKSLLDDVFNNDPYGFVSFTTHSGSIAALLEVIGHRPFRLPTGALMPVLVKAEWYGDGRDVGVVADDGDPAWAPEVAPPEAKTNVEAAEAAGVVFGSEPEATSYVG